MIQKEPEAAFGYLSIGLEYLHLVKAVANETINQGNRFTVNTEEVDGKDFDKTYQELTKWSDHNIIIPILFNFLHGLETILKGSLISEGIETNTNHKLNKLLSDFELNFPGSPITSIISKYIKTEQLPPILSKFCEESGISMDDYYQALKYPESTKGNIFKHYPLKYRNEPGLPFFQELVTDIEKITCSVIAIRKTIYPNA